MTEVEIKFKGGIGEESGIRWRARDEIGRCVYRGGGSRIVRPIQGHGSPLMPEKGIGRPKENTAIH